MLKSVPIRAVIALAMIVVSLLVLERARSGVMILHTLTGDTPVVTYQKANATGPVVVIAHGFAGSEQMMQGFALPLARAGYRVHVFEFLGHGQNQLPMSGDVTSVDGTTRLLVEQTTAIVDSVTDGTVALLGHSMATDILVRVAQGRDDIGPIVLVSAFSQVITASFPPDLLLISGAWESGLRGLSLDALRMIDPDAKEGMTVRQGNLKRRAVAAPFSEHVSVLQSRTARREAVAWFDQAYDRSADVSILPTGWAIIGLMAGIVLMVRPFTELLAKAPTDPTRLSGLRTGIVLVVPLLATPVIALALNLDVLPVLVADYLGLHLLIFGAIQLALLRFWRIPFGPVSWSGLAMILIWCAVFGFALDRYAANFWPTPQRLWIIAVLMLGAVPYMIADAVLTHGCKPLRRITIRLAFFASLGLALALDFERLFFLFLIAPVLVLFFVIYGFVGRAVSRRVGPMSSGVALGLALAWALGVSFPLFQT